MESSEVKEPKKPTMAQDDDCGLAQLEAD